MIGMVCVREDLFNGLGSEESADHRTSSVCGDSEGRRRINVVPFHMGSSIAGHFHSSRMACVLLLTVRLVHRPVPRSVARAARKKASNNRRWRGCRSKRNSGGHWIPGKKRGGGGRG